MIQKCNLPVATVRAISEQKIEMEKIPRRSMLLYGRMRQARWNWITSSPLGRKVWETRKYTRAHVNEHEILRTPITEEKCRANSQAWRSSVYWQVSVASRAPTTWSPLPDQSQFPLQLPPLPRNEHKFFLVRPTTCFLYWNYWHGLSRHCLQFSTIDGAIRIVKNIKLGLIRTYFVFRNIINPDIKLRKISWKTRILTVIFPTFRKHRSRKVYIYIYIYIYNVTLIATHNLDRNAQFSEVNLLTLDENCSNKHDLNLYRYTCFKIFEWNFILYLWDSHFASNASKFLLTCKMVNGEIKLYLEYMK